MNKYDIAERWPLVLKHFDAVVRVMERPLGHTPHKVSRRLALTTFRNVMNVRETGRVLGVSAACVNDIVRAAYFVARDIDAKTAIRARRRRP
jgi:hypothetical protein